MGIIYGALKRMQDSPSCISVTVQHEHDGHKR